MNERLESLIYLINHAVVKAVIHLSNGAYNRDTTYLRGEDISFDLDSICDIINEGAGEELVYTALTKVYETELFNMRDGSFGNIIQNNRSVVYIGFLPLIRYEGDEIDDAWYIYKD